MDLRSSSIPEYDRGLPIFRVHVPNPERFRHVAYAVKFKLFKMPHGAVLACIVDLYDIPDRPFYIHRVYDLGDPRSRKYVRALGQLGEWTLIFESAGQMEGFRRTILIGHEPPLEALIKEGAEYNISIRSAAGPEALSHFLSWYQSRLLEARGNAEEAWRKVGEDIAHGGRSSGLVADQPRAWIQGGIGLGAVCAAAWIAGGKLSGLIAVVLSLIGAGAYAWVLLRRNPRGRFAMMSALGQGAQARSAAEEAGAAIEERKPRRVALEYCDGAPAWRIRVPNPEHFKDVDYSIEFRLFCFSEGAVVALLLRLYDAPDQPYFVHRVLDMSDPSVQDYLDRLSREARCVLVFQSAGRQAGFSRAIEISTDSGVGDVLRRGAAHNASLTRLDGRAALEEYLGLFDKGVMEAKGDVPKVWRMIKERCSNPF